MDHLEIKNRSILSIRKWLGIFLIIIGIGFFITTKSEKHRAFYLIASIAFALNGVYHLTNGFGLERAWLRSGHDFLTVKWSNMLNPVTIHCTRIARISFSGSKVIIYQRARKAVKLDLSYLEQEEKKKVFDFFNQFSVEKSLELIRESK